MADRIDLALQALRQMRSGAAYRRLATAERSELDQHVRQLEGALAARGRDLPGHGGRDIYASLLGTPADLRSGVDPVGGGPTPPTPLAPAPAAAPALPPPPGTAEIGGRAADALEAVGFPGFVAALVTGTFQAIVDATTRQIKEYADLVASLSRSVEDFSRDNVTPNQVRNWFSERYRTDLTLVLPAPGRTEGARLVPRPDRAGTSPAWLGQYGLAGQELTEELTEGPLLEAGHLKVGEERLQTLATLVLMGINRVVVSDGDIKARMNFHAIARETGRAEVEGQQVGIAAQQVSSVNNTAMMVSTLKANAQSDAAIKADLMGEVRIAFRSETFPVERFADSAAIQLINRHARWKGDEPAAAPVAPAPPATPTVEAGGESK